MEEVIVVGGIKLDKHLGEGAFSRVKRGVDLKTGQHYAVKIINREDLADPTIHKQIKREIDIMSRIDHPNIIHLYKVMNSKDYTYLVLELAEGGELFSKIADDGPLPEPIARRYFQKLVDALDYMHKRGAIHRDLKPENILFDTEDNLKITDFGLSIISNTKSGQPDYLKTRCGTPNYVAPEIFAPNGYLGAPADVWGAGMILYVMFTAILPFDADSVQEVVNMVCHGRLEMPESIPRDVQKLLMKILVRDPSKRYTIENIREDPWFKIDYHQTVFPETVKASGSDFEIDVVEQTLAEYQASAQPGMNAFELLGRVASVELRPIIDGSGSNNTSLSFTFRKSIADVRKAIEKKIKEKPSNINENTMRILITGKSTISFTLTTCHIAGGINLFQMTLLRGSQDEFNRIFESYKKEFTK